jgi:predicted metal-dependent phosphoesterase TrpH
VTATDGWRLDPHIKLLDDAVVARAKRRGLDALVYAPHFTRLPAIERAAAAHSDDELSVIPARELFTGSWRDRKHVLAIGLDEPVPDFLPLDATLAECRRQGAAVLVPHPTFLTVSLDDADCRRHRDAIDAIETYNPKHLPLHNRRARSLATALDCPAFGSSYAHRRATVGEVWTTFDAAHPTATELATALKSGAPRTVEHRDGLSHRWRCGLEFAHLGWENSWKKFERVALSGLEPTHPSHPAYEGRFDDVAVY